VSERLDILVDVALVQKNKATAKLSVHRLVQAEFRYFASSAERQTHFEAASRLLYEAFPKQSDERFGPRIIDCDKIIKQVYALRDNVCSPPPELTKLQPTDEFCKLMRHASWYCVEVHRSTELERTVTTAMTAAETIGFDKREPEHYAQLCNCASRMWAQRGNFAEAKKLMEKSLQVRKSIDDKGLWGAYNNLGNIYLSMRQPEKALELYKQCSDLYPDEATFPRHALKMNKLNVGRTYTLLGQFSEAETLLQGARQLNEDWLMGIQ